MAPATNWLSFSLSPVEMMRSSDQSQFVPFDSSSAPTYLIDNLYSNGWCTNSKPQLFYPEGDNNQPRDAPSIADSPIQTSFLDPESHSQSAPKLADFFGGESMVRYSDDQTETQNSDLFRHQARFRANSVNDSGSITRTQLAEFNGYSTESSRNELGLSSCPTGALSLGVAQNQTQCSENQHNSDININNKPIVPAGAVADSDCTRRIVDTFGQRTSIYRGVTRHRWTGRYEAHLWDNSCRREGQARKGRQVYLGGYDKEEKAARAYDLAALKYWGHSANTNFPVLNYANEIEEMKNSTKQEFIASLRRKSSGFSRGASMYRGVTRHHQQGRWQARIGRVAGNKDLYLGTFATEEEAAEAYDIAAIKFRGVNAVTNFEMSRYNTDAISTSALPIGGAAKRLKLLAEPSSNCISFEALQPVSNIPCGVPLEASTASQLYHRDSLFRPDPTSTSQGMLNQHQPGEFYLWPHHSYN